MEFTLSLHGKMRRIRPTTGKVPDHLKQQPFDQSRDREGDVIIEDQQRSTATERRHLWAGSATKGSP